MKNPISINTQAILLLTAPLITGRNETSSEYLKPSEYKLLTRFLRARQKQPSDLVGSDAQELVNDLGTLFDINRLARLLGRGFLLSQAVDLWQARTIWIISRADPEYPQRLKDKLKEDAPPVLYGCGDLGMINDGGLAVVGSRHVTEDLIEYSHRIGRLAARASQSIISGGARGIDQASMRGALEGGGRAIGVMADSLGKAAIERENREFLLNETLLLISPYDPSSGFNVGNAMQRNKIIYALADAALVVNSDYQSGGTWAGAYEQLTKLKHVTTFVRSGEGIGTGLKEIMKLGAKPWPDPKTPEDLIEVLHQYGAPKEVSSIQAEIPLVAETPTEQQFVPIICKEAVSALPDIGKSALAKGTNGLSENILGLLKNSKKPLTSAELATSLNEDKKQINKHLKAMVTDGKVNKIVKPVRYLICSPKLFD